MRIVKLFTDTESNFKTFTSVKFLQKSPRLFLMRNRNKILKLRKAEFTRIYNKYVNNHK